MIAIAAQLAQTAKTLDDKVQTHAMEPKLDGFRAIIQKVGDDVHYWSRAGNEQDGKVPHIDEQLRCFPPDFVMDGEIIFEKSWHEVHERMVLVSDFSQTMKIIGSYPEKAIAKQLDVGPLTLVAFDLMELNHIPVIEWEDRMRRNALEAIVEGTAARTRANGLEPAVLLSPRWNSGEWDPAWYDEMVELGAEGVMLKDEQAPYSPGLRSHAWLKHKNVATADVVFMGITEGKKALEGLAGAVVFGQYDGRLLKERGKCSGMTDKVRRDITENWKEYTREERVLEIAYNGFVVADGTFRHPQWKGFRDDKLSKECTWTKADV